MARGVFALRLLCDRIGPPILGSVKLGPPIFSYIVVKRIRWWKSEVKDIYELYSFCVVAYDLTDLLTAKCGKL